MSAWFAEQAWVGEGGGRLARNVLIEADGETISAVTLEAAPPPGTVRLPGLVLPGLVNTHSHAFHRVLRGRTEVGRGAFWTWRSRMYEAAARLDPDRYRALASAVYTEMALAGVTAVGEFHYVHHRRGGGRYDEPNVMQEALAAAAADAGVRLTLLDTCYLRGGFGQPLDEVQRRFSDGDVEAWAERAAARVPQPHLRLAAAIHSVRAVDTVSMQLVRDWAAKRACPLHVHVSEQPAENEACAAATGTTPTGLLDRHGVLGPATTVVHATHVDASDVRALGAAGTRVCACPTTERALADGVGPASALAAAGCSLSLGSDSHAVIDLFEEARAVELDERLVTGRRGLHRAEDLLAAATRGGALSLDWDAGEITTGRLCDLVAVDLDTPRLAGFAPRDAAAFAVFAAGAADVTHVVVGGRPVVDDRCHRSVAEPATQLRAAITAVLP